ncbi:MAG TPA: UDP-N-acetylglucosamine 1-carboxyvinyltransferase [Candidatus Eisenbacteria bacterium]|nr:UDP-N-acetylglucosamine 1-carboxyvinyltransferase [Candidatus Eisenbacteria bacterium]
MDKLVIQGGRRLEGTVEISGAKNASLPILAATVLTKEPSVIKNVPQVADVFTMVKILKGLGAKVTHTGNTVEVDPKNISKPVLTYKLVSTMRGSICFLGPLLARFGEAQVSFPGGCVIGPRPIDLHLKGVKALGTEVTLNHGYVMAKVKKLKGARIYLGGAFGSSVLGTGNVMMAAVLAQGRTVIDNAACEPEVVDLGNFLKKMGARITGLGSPSIEIEGVKKLSGANYSLIPDRIEAGTYMIASAITKGDVTLRNMNLDMLGAMLDKLRDAGVQIVEKNGHVRVRRERVLRPISVTTLPYPGYPTDLQAQMMALMCVVPGISVITEKIYPERFMHVSELNRMGASIMLEGPSAIVSGKKTLSGAPVMASDLRASAALVLAGLVAEGQTEVSRVYHLDRGYENLVAKLQSLGAKIAREKDIR